MRLLELLFPASTRALRDEGYHEAIRDMLVVPEKIIVTQREADVDWPDWHHNCTFIGPTVLEGDKQFISGCKFYATGTALSLKPADPKEDSNE
jgi:hypothetical protein